MTPIVWTYLSYLILSVSLTVWVAKTLHKNGRIFLVDAFLGNEQLADSINHLLVVGFYLINIGYVSLALREGHIPTDFQGVLETLSRKVGVVLLVLGGDALLQSAGVFENAETRPAASRPAATPTADANSRGGRMKRLYVLFDGECSLCGRCRDWLARQPAYLELYFLPFQVAGSRSPLSGNRCASSRGTASGHKR